MLCSVEGQKNETTHGFSRRAAGRVTGATGGQGLPAPQPPLGSLATHALLQCCLVFQTPFSLLSAPLSDSPVCWRAQVLPGEMVRGTVAPSPPHHPAALWLPHAGNRDIVFPKTLFRVRLYNSSIHPTAEVHSPYGCPQTQPLGGAGTAGDPPCWAPHGETFPESPSLGRGSSQPPLTSQPRRAERSAAQPGFASAFDKGALSNKG